MKSYKILSKLVKIILENFGSRMKRLARRNVTSIPIKVYDVNGNITADIKDRLHGWKLSFEGLLNRPGEVGFENYFEEKCINDKLKTNILF